MRTALKSRTKFADLERYKRIRKTREDSTVYKILYQLLLATEIL